MKTKRPSLSRKENTFPRWPRTYQMYPEVHKVSKRLRAPEEVEADEA